MGRWWMGKAVGLALATGVLFGAGSVAADEGQVVYRLSINQPITVASHDYLDRGLRLAEDQGAAAALVELNTPGGDVSTTVRMVSRILNAKVPVLIWVGPAGAQAASAGTFLVLAGHAAGMAPRTTIGAASPVGPGGAELPTTARRKATEDIAALGRSLAERRGAQARSWAEKAVREAASASAEEALALGIIDALADSAGDFLERVDGKAVTVGGRRLALRTARATLRDVPPSSAERLLAVLIHPAVALLLLTVGVNAILIELASPGGFVPGLVGVLALALAFYSLGVLAANWVGLVFIGAAFVLFVLDLQSPTHGLLTAAGIGMFVLGAVVLFQGGWFAIPWATIGALAVGLALFFALAVGAVVRTMRRRPLTGTEGLLGSQAVVRQPLVPEGMVFVDGELWRARLVSGASVPAGVRVRVVAREGSVLVVDSDAEPRAPNAAGPDRTLR